MADKNFSQIFKNLFLFLIELCKSIYWAFVPFVYRRPLNLENQVVLITGAGQGIGQCLALKFAQLGCKLVLVDINKSSLNETKTFLEERHSSDVWTYQLDVADRAAVYDMAKMVKKDVGQVSVVVNNAAIVSGKMFLDLKDEEIERTVNVNFMGYLWITKAFLPDMVQLGQGHLVYLCSGAVFTPCGFLSDYSATKCAVAGFTETLGQEILFKGWDNIKVSTVFPFLVWTPLVDPEDFDGLVFGMDPKYVADVIVNGVLIGLEKIYVPRLLYFITWLKPFLSVKALLYLMRVSLGEGYFKKDAVFQTKKRL